MVFRLEAKKFSLDLTASSFLCLPIWSHLNKVSPFRNHRVRIWLYDWESKSESKRVDWNLDKLHMFPSQVPWDNIHCEVVKSPKASLLKDSICLLLFYAVQAAKAYRTVEKDLVLCHRINHHNNSLLLFCLLGVFDLWEQDLKNQAHMKCTVPFSSETRKKRKSPFKLFSTRPDVWSQPEFRTETLNTRRWGHDGFSRVLGETAPPWTIQLNVLAEIAAGQSGLWSC